MITLAAPHVAQVAFQSDQVAVLQNDDRPRARKLRSLVELGGSASHHYWVDVYDGENYNPDWTDADVEKAIKAYFVELARA